MYIKNLIFEKLDLDLKIFFGTPCIKDFYKKSVPSKIKFTCPKGFQNNPPDY